MTKPNSSGAAASKATSASTNKSAARPNKGRAQLAEAAALAATSGATKMRKVGTIAPLTQPTDDIQRHAPAEQDSAGGAPQSSAPQSGPVAPADMTARAFREDPDLDRHIIDGMLEDKDAFLDSMQHQGYARESVLRRAAELGLSEALIRQVMGVAADLAGERPGRRRAPSSLGARKCLQCDRVFLSSGPGNRLCMRCRGGDAGLAQL